MAIGSAPEIGVTFRQFGDCKTEAERQAWYDRVRVLYGGDGLTGYATLGYPRKTQAQVLQLREGTDGNND